MSLHRRTYLVVDDLELMRTVTVNLLRTLGCERILTARNGADALRILQSQRVDVVLADWKMPVMSGLELLRTVRADPVLCAMPFLMITAESERQQIEEVIQAGVSGVLVKPYNRNSLEARLRKMFAEAPVAQSAPAQASGPVTPATATQSTPDETSSHLGLMPTRILVVDDYPVSLTLLTHLFRDDYQVLTATDGATALRICRSKPSPDLVLRDVMMPDMYGFEVVRRMRETPEAAHIPVIFVTGLTDDAARLRGMELGAVDFVSKNTDPKVLRSRVRNFIKFVDMRRQLQVDYDAMLEAARLREDVENITRHDLKGSLAGIVGMVQGLADDQTMAERHVAQLRLIEQTALQVMDMVNLSSELYKMETGQFRLNATPVDIGHILHRLAELARSAFQSSALTVEVDTDQPLGTEPPQAQGDAMLCYSLFQNLIKNACEAAPARSRVRISLCDENPLRVQIRNTGAVPPALRERFFEKFATSGKAGGSGIGTYSARMLARAQQGSVDMETSDEENSTTLTVTLPRHLATSGAARP